MFHVALYYTPPGALRLVPLSIRDTIYKNGKETAEGKHHLYHRKYNITIFLLKKGLRGILTPGAN